MPFCRWALHGRPIPLSQTHHSGLECGRKESRGLSGGGIVWPSFVFPRFYKRSLVLRYKCVSTHERQVPFTKQGKDFILTSQRSKLHKASYSTTQGGSRGQREGESPVQCLEAAVTCLCTVPVRFPEMDSYSRLQNTYCVPDLESSTTL